jgi:hypothetical protein
VSGPGEALEWGAVADQPGVPERVAEAALAMFSPRDFVVADLICGAVGACVDRPPHECVGVDRPASGCQFDLTRALCQSKLTPMMDEPVEVELSAQLAASDPVVGFRAVLALRRLAERVEARQVALARAQGWSWQQIGDALGVTRQSVHTKYGK